MTIELRHYQDQAIDAVLAEWAEGHRATLLVAATGLGKTTMFAELLRRRASHGRSLVIAHREELINQAAARIEAQTGLTVGVEMADSRSSHLQPQQVVVATMQTLRGKRLGGFPKDAFATIVIDEAHRSLAKSYRTIADHFAGAKLLGVTATPDRSDKLGLGAVYQSVAYQYDIAEAIADGWLVPLVQHRVHCSALDVSQVRSQPVTYPRPTTASHHGCGVAQMPSLRPH
jgi:superfamily II DNA or RNA helicase